MSALDNALDILTSGTAGLSQRRMQELQMTLSMMEMQMRRDRMDWEMEFKEEDYRQQILRNQQLRQRENSIYALDQADVFLKENKLNAANAVIGNLVALTQYSDGDSIKKIKKQLKKSGVTDENIQGAMAGIIFNYYSDSEGAQLAAIESATSLSNYIMTEYEISKETNKATPSYDMFIKTGLVAQPTIKSVGADGKSIEVPNPNVEDSLKPYFNLSETRNIKRNIAKERIEIGGGDYSIQSDIILPTEITASLEAMAGTPEVFKKTLEDMKKVISGETPIVETVDSTTTPGLDVPKTSKELLLEWKEIENSINELEKKKSNAQRLIGQGFTGEVENDLSALIQQIDEKKELEITARKNYRERYSKERFTSEDAKEALKASGLEETTENIQEMKKHLRKIKTEGIDVGERGMDMLF
jgi:hypothetical protein